MTTGTDGVSSRSGSLPAEESTNPTAVDRPARFVRISLAATNRHLIWTVISVALFVGAIGLYIVGLPPISFHGPLHYVGIMDPLCGGTRATLALSQGDLATSFKYNPGVPFLALYVAAGMIRVLAGLITRKWLTVNFSHPRLVRWVFIAALIVLTIRQQAHADLLMAWGIEGR